MRHVATNKIIRCCHCRGMMRVTSRALSVFCPHCQKRVILESLRIVGTHPGRSLATCGDILVETTSWLNLEIKANNIVIRGLVRGSIKAYQSVEVSSTGRVFGDVKAPKIIVREGGIIQGRCEMMPEIKEMNATTASHEEEVGQNEEAISPDMATTPSSASTTSDMKVRPHPQPHPPRQIRPIQIDPNVSH